MEKLIRKIIANRTPIIFIVFILFAAGVFSLFKMSKSVFPEVIFPQIVIKINSGYAPLENMEMNIVKKMEDSMQTVAGLKYMTSKIRRGSAEVNLTFDWGVNVDQAYQSVLTKASEVKSVLPADSLMMIRKMTTSTYPFSGYSLYSDTYSLVELRDIAEHTIKPQIESLDGIDMVEVIGGVCPEYEVIIKPEKLMQYHITSANVIDAVRNANRIDFLGSITQEYRFLLTVADYRLNGKRDIEDILIKRRQGQPVYLKQVAQVLESVSRQVSITSTDGHSAVLFNIIMHPNADVVRVSKLVGQKMNHIRQHLPKGMKISKWYDLADFVKKALNSIMINILSGILIISVVVLIFLRSARSSIPIIIAMPLTIAVSFLLMKVFGLSLNVMTLGGLTAALGLLVDDVSIIVENIIRHRETGEEETNAVISGSAEIIPASIFGTITTIIVFLPMTMLNGVHGFFFKPFFSVATIALSLSLLLSIFVTPLLVSYIQRHRGGRKVFHPEGKIPEIYKKVLTFSLKRSGFVTFLSGVIVCAAIIISFHVSTQYLPVWDEGTFIMDIDTKPGTSLAEMDRVVRGVEKVIKSIPEIRTYTRSTGDDEVRPNEAHFYLRPQNLPGKSRLSTFKIMDKLEKRLSDNFPYLNIDLHQILPDRFNNLIGHDNTITLELYGDNADSLDTAKKLVTRAVESLPAVKAVKGKHVDKQPEIFISYNKVKLAKMGLDESDVSGQVETALHGTVATHIVSGVKNENVRIVYPARYGKFIDDIKQIPVFSATGAVFPLMSVATVSIKNVREMVFHKNGMPVIYMDVKTKNADLRGNVRKIQGALDKVSLPAGFSVQLGGDWARQLSAFGELMVILSLAALFIFAILLLEFKNYRIASIIFFGTLFSLSFIVFGLVITNTSFNVSTFMGFITSMGIAVNNGILIMDFAEKYKSRNLDAEKRIVMAGLVRIRPILITSITTIGGFLPMAMSLGGGGEMLQPFAVAVISGLLGSIFFSLIVIPTLYYRFERQEIKNG